MYYTLLHAKIRQKKIYLSWTMDLRCVLQLWTTLTFDPTINPVIHCVPLYIGSLYCTFPKTDYGRRAFSSSSCCFWNRHQSLTITWLLQTSPQNAIIFPPPIATASHLWFIFVNFGAMLSNILHYIYITTLAQVVPEMEFGISVCSYHSNEVDVERSLPFKDNGW